MKIKVLLLEDDAQFSEIIAEYLKENSCAVTLAYDGQTKRYPVRMTLT